MKKQCQILMIAVILAAFTIVSFAQSKNLESKPKNDSPTLQETLNFLSEKLSANATTGNGSMSVNFEILKFSGCDVSWRSKSTIFNILIGNEIGFPLKSLSEVFYEESKPYSPLWMLILKTEKPVISTQLINEYGKRETIKYASGIHILLKDKESAEKISKAFTHAAKLCRETKELF